MKTERASLQFLGYRVDKMMFFLKPDFHSEPGRIELSPSFSRVIQPIDDHYEVTIGVELKQENLPFDADVSITGTFKCEGTSDAEKMIKMNAVAIMYPYVRATLSMLTTLASVAPVVVPTINLSKMFEEEEKTTN